MVTLRFDRGTILCDVPPLLGRDRGVDHGPLQHGPPRHSPLRHSPLRWDPRVACYRAKAKDHQGVREWLSRAGIEFDDVVAAPLRPARFHQVPLRSYQHAAFDAWRLAADRGVVVLPTGGGKTRVAVHAMAATARPALVLVPTRVLMHQWYDVLREFCRDEVGLLGDGEREVRAVTVATFESARRGMHRFGNRFELLVIDEVHHFGAIAGCEVLEMSTAPRRLGLTATMPDGPGLQRLGELVGPVTFALQVADLVGSYLADFEIIELRLALNQAERRAHDAAHRVFRTTWDRFLDLAPGASWQDFVRSCQRSQSGRDVLRQWRAAKVIASWTEAKSHMLGSLLDRHRDSRTLVFAADQATVRSIAERHWIMPVTAGTGRRERQWALETLRNGQLRALVSAKVLNEGVDVPAADVAIVVGSSQGTREYVQRIGRVLRPQEGKRAFVYELISSATAEVGQAARRRGAFGAGRAGPVHGS